MSDPILYHSPGACSLSIHAALRQAEVAFTPVRVDVRAGEQLAEHYAGDCDDARAAVRDTAVGRLRAIYAELEAAVARRDVFSGDAPGLLDLYTAVYLRWAQVLPEPALGPALIAYRERLAAHPPLAAALDAEGVSLNTMKRRSDP